MPHDGHRRGGPFEVHFGAGALLLGGAGGLCVAAESAPAEAESRRAVPPFAASRTRRSIALGSDAEHIATRMAFGVCPEASRRSTTVRSCADFARRSSS